MKEIDNYINGLNKQSNYIKNSLEIIKDHGEFYASRIFTRAIELGKVEIANSFYKGIIINKLHETNEFKNLVQKNAWKEYLDVLDTDEIYSLLNSFTYITLYGYDNSFVENKHCIELLNSYIKDNITLEK